MRNRPIAMDIKKAEIKAMIFFQDVEPKGMTQAA